MAYLYLSALCKWFEMIVIRRPQLSAGLDVENLGAKDPKTLTDLPSAGSTGPVRPCMASGAGPGCWVSSYVVAY
jgi:hypothetical protein